MCNSQYLIFHHILRQYCWPGKWWTSAFNSKPRRLRVTSAADRRLCSVRSSRWHGSRLSSSSTASSFGERSFRAEDSPSPFPLHDPLHCEEQRVPLARVEVRGLSSCGSNSSTISSTVSTSF